MKNHIIKSPGFRRYGYLVLTAIVALLIGYGLVDAEHGDLWKELIYAIFGLGFITAAANTPDKDASEQEDEITFNIDDIV